MTWHRNDLIKMGSVIIHSLPESYQPALQTITAAKWLGASVQAQHWVINAERSRNGDSALMVHGWKGKQAYGPRCKKSKSNVTCENCGKSRHTQPDCYSKGGGKEGQGPQQKKFNTRREKKFEKSMAVAKGEDEGLFAFTCTSNYLALTNSLKLPKDKYSACMDSGASDHYCPDRDWFQNYWPLENLNIMTANGWTLKKDMYYGHNSNGKWLISSCQCR